MNILIFFHILAMFIGFALTAGTGLFLAIISTTNDVAAIRVAAQTNLRLNMVGGISLLVGLVLGFAIAGQAGFALTATWLVVTYVAVALILILGFGVHMPWVRRLANAAQASGTTPSPTLAAVAHDPMQRIAGPITGVLWIVVIAMMVLRP